MKNTRIGRVYKIISKHGNEIYIGSTFNTTRDRFRQHKYDYNRYVKNDTNFCAAYILFDKYGYENCHIILIKEYEVIDRHHLQVYESLWIKKLASINKIMPSGGLLRRRYCKLYYVEWYKQNKEYMAKKRKTYYDLNKEVIKAKNRLYAEKNKDSIRVKRCERYHLNKEYAKCDLCNCEIMSIGMKAHKNSKKHRKRLDTVSEIMI